MAYVQIGHSFLELMISLHGYWQRILAVGKAQKDDDKQEGHRRNRGKYAYSSPTECADGQERRRLVATGTEVRGLYAGLEHFLALRAADHLPRK